MNFIKQKTKLTNYIKSSAKILFFSPFVVLMPAALIFSQEAGQKIDVFLTETQTEADSTIKESTGMLRNTPDNVREYSLGDVISLAVEHNRTLKRLRLSRESANIRLKQAEYRFLPSAYINAGRTEASSVSLGQAEKTQTLNSNFGFYRALETGGAVSVGMRNSSNESSANSGITNYNSGLSVAVSQPLLRGRGIKVNKVPIERAKNYAKTSMLSVKQSTINIITIIESQYWDLILAYEDLEIQKDALERAKELLEINKSLIESGRMAAQEIIQTESDIASRDITVAAAENTIISTQVGMQGSLDLGERIMIKPTTKMEFDPRDINLEECLHKAYKFRPDWLIHKLYHDIYKMNLVVSKNNTLYALNSSASIGSDITRNDGLRNSLQDALGLKDLSWNIGLGFTFPFNKQVLQNYYELSRLSLESQEIYMEELEDDIRIYVENAVRNAHFTLKQVGLAQRAKVLAKQKLELEEEKMKVGRSSNFQVISYQRDLTNAQNVELVRIAGYLKALGRLEQSMGTTLQRWELFDETIE
jgi:outer membrane protein TolC